jgi:hypothetical protein
MPLPLNLLAVKSVDDTSDYRLDDIGWLGHELANTSLGHESDLMEHGITRAKEILAAAEATDICFNSPILYGGWHLLGTARMGIDPTRSVVNPWGRSHDAKNLFIVDGSLFVTSGGVTRHPPSRPSHRRSDEAAPAYMCTAWRKRESRGEDNEGASDRRVGKSRPDSRTLVARQR